MITLCTILYLINVIVLYNFKNEYNDNCLHYENPKMNIEILIPVLNTCICPIILYQIYQNRQKYNNEIWNII